MEDLLIVFLQPLSEFFLQLLRHTTAATASLETTRLVDLLHEEIAITRGFLLTRS